ncbi:MAG: hypothetical protein U0Q18_25120 [Bryobacteraceae bacterium]
MSTAEVRVTSEALWRGILLAAPADAVLVSLLVRRIDAAAYRRLKWPITVVTTVFFAALWATLASYLFWGPVYRFLFPEWSRWVLPAAYGLGFGGTGYLSYCLAPRVWGNRVVNFCLLLGLWGMAGHVWAVRRGLLEKVPMLQGASAAAAVIFSGFEFVFYGAVILNLAALFVHAAPEDSTGVHAGA